MPTADSQPVEALQRRLGATLTSGDGVEVPAHYGDPERERALLEEGCGLFDASFVDCLEMRGEDRHRFLSGLVTADVREFAVGESRYGLFATVKGRILADVTVLAHQESFWLRLPPGRGEGIAEHLEKHVITDRVEIAPLRERSLLLVGATAHERIAEWLGADREAPPAAAHRPAQILGVDVTVATEPRLGRPAVSLWAAPADLDRLASALVEENGVEPVGFEALERLRIESGLPRFGADFGPETFPQEAGLDEAVSYEKGCYLGQEVIARIHYRGGVNRRLVALEGESEELPDDEDGLRLDGEEVGRITSRAARFSRPGWCALAMVKTKAAEPGTPLTLSSGSKARVLEPAG